MSGWSSCGPTRPRHGRRGRGGREYREVFRELAAAAPRRASPRPEGNPIPVVVDAWVALQTLRAAAERPDRRHRSRAGGDRAGTPGGAAQGSRRADLAGACPDRLGHHREPDRPFGGGIDGRPGQRRRRQRAHHAPTPTCSAAATRAPRSRSSSIRRTRVAGRRRRACLRPASGGRRAGHGRPRSSVAGCDGRRRGAVTTLIRPQRRRLRRDRPRHPGRPSATEGEQAESPRRQATPGDQGRVGHADHGRPADRRAQPGPGPLHVHRGHRAPGRARRSGPGDTDHAQRRRRLRRRHHLRPAAIWRGGSRSPRQATWPRWSMWSRCRSATSASPRTTRWSTSGLWQVIKVLLDLGVVVVAAAGTTRLSRKFYPAAFALETGPGRGRAGDQRGRAQPERHQGHLQRRRRLGDGVGPGRRRGQHLPGRRRRQPHPRAQDSASPGNPMPPGVSLPGREALDPDDYSWWLGSLERHVVLGSAAWPRSSPGRCWREPSDTGSGLELTPCGQQATHGTGRWPP